MNFKHKQRNNLDDATESENKKAVKYNDYGYQMALAYEYGI